MSDSSNPANVLVATLETMTAKNRDAIIGAVNAASKKNSEDLNKILAELLLRLEEHGVVMGQLTALITDLSRSSTDAKRRPRVTAGKAADDASAADTKSAPATPNVPKLPSNKMLWFKQQVQADVQYGEDGVTVVARPTMDSYIDKLTVAIPNLRETMEADPAIVNKKNEVQKNKSRATFLWTQIKSLDGTPNDIGPEIQSAYDDAKKQFNLAMAAPQQTVENHTPEPAADAAAPAAN